MHSAKGARMSRPDSYREQDGCWNCRHGHNRWGEPIVDCEKHTPENELMTETSLYGICNDHDREEGQDND